MVFFIARTKLYKLKQRFSSNNLALLKKFLMRSMVNVWESFKLLVVARYKTVNQLFHSQVLRNLILPILH
jgi:hypothetical protein